MRHGKAWCIPCGMESPFSFPLAEKKTAIHGQKKDAEGELTGKAVNSSKRRLAVTHCQQNPEVAYRLRYTRISNQHIPAFESAEHNGEKTGHPMLLFPLPLRFACPGSSFPVLSSSLLCASPWGKAGFSCPVPRLREARFPRKRHDSRPFVPRGCRDGARWRPPCFGWGSKGEGPLR